MSESLEAGILIGDFRIERRIGAGGMGVVDRARQVSQDRVVALKVLGAALTREADKARFRREAQAVARLDHPGIAKVYYVGQDDQVCFMAMEYVDGGSLRELVDRLAAIRDPGLSIESALEQPTEGGHGPDLERFDEPTATYTPGQPPEAGPAPCSPTEQAGRLIASRGYVRRCCELVRDAAKALDHAHGRGVIHRDVKPENILRDRRGRVRLIDFGVARLFEDVTLTRTGALVGTPMYMSPEQVIGRLTLDRRTDIYSLGLVLYEFLTLLRPIAAPTRGGVLRCVVSKA